MKAYIYESVWTQELEDAIESSPTKPLIMEMFHKFGLKAYARFVSDEYGGNKLDNAFMMTLDGFPYCRVDVSEVSKLDADGNEVFIPQYSYRSAFYTKARSSSNGDNKTLSSIKLSSLMKTLEKNNAVPTSMEELTDKTAINGIIAQIRNKQAVRETRKNPYDVNPDYIQEALASILAGDNTAMSHDTLNHCKFILDKWQRVDQDNKTYQENMNSILGNEMHILYTDKADGIVVGKVKLELNADKDRVRSVDVVEPFRRYLDIHDYENFADIGGLLTMFKVHLEGLDRSRIIKDYFYCKDDYLPDLNIASYYTDGQSYDGGIWLCLPN